MSDPSAQSGARDDGDALHSAPLLVRSSSGDWVRPDTTTWDAEQQLRDLVRAQPTLIPGVADPATRAVIEFHVPGSGFADVVAVEPDGRITICEVKLERNPEIRRKVVGQLLAYAAGISQLSAAEFISIWDGCRGDRLELDDLGLTGTALQEQLASGRFRLVFVVDGLTDELRSVITYLVDQTSDGLDIVAVEIEYARHDNVEILIPRTFGAELSASRSGPRQRGAKPVSPPMDDETIRPIIDAAERRVAGAGAVVERIASGLAPIVTNLYLSSSDSEDALLCARDPKAEMIKFVNSQTTPGVRLCLDYMHRFGVDRLADLVTTLRSHPEFAPYLQDLEPPFKKRPLFPYDVFVGRPELAKALVDGVLQAQPDS